MELLAELIEEKCQFLRKRIDHLDGNYLLSSQFVTFENNIKIQGEQLQIGNVVARRINWNERVKNLIKSGFSSPDIINALTSNQDNVAESFLIGKIYLNSNTNVGAEIDLIRKYVRGILSREYLLCFYTLSFKNDKYRLMEETSDWENGITLIARSIYDFEKNPTSFINDRIKKWQTKEKEPL